MYNNSFEEQEQENNEGHFSDFKFTSSDRVPNYEDVISLYGHTFQKEDLPPNYKNITISPPPSYKTAIKEDTIELTPLSEINTGIWHTEKNNPNDPNDHNDPNIRNDTIITEEISDREINIIASTTTENNVNTNSDDSEKPMRTCCGCCISIFVIFWIGILIWILLKNSPRLIFLLIRHPTLLLYVCFRFLFFFIFLKQN